MKYIKLFETFDDLKSIQDDINDICLELKDNGFVLYYSSESGYMGGKNIHYATIKRINKNSSLNSFKFDEVKEDVLRVKDYLGDRYRLVKVQPGYNGSYITIDPNDTSLGNHPIYAVGIGFSLID